MTAAILDFAAWCGPCAHHETRHTQIHGCALCDCPAFLDEIIPNDFPGGDAA